MIQPFQNHNNQFGNIKKVLSCIEISWLWIQNIEKDENDIRDLIRELMQMSKGQTVLEDIFKYIQSPSDKEQLIKIFMNELLTQIDKPDYNIKEVTFIDSEIKAVLY